MTDTRTPEKKLKKMSRLELLEILYAQSRELERLQGELAEARKQLNVVADANILADAARELSALIRSGSPAQPSPAAPVFTGDAGEILAQAREEAQRMLVQTRAECDAMVETAKADSQAWWAETAAKLDAFYQERPGLRDMLSAEYTGEE